MLAVAMAALLRMVNCTLASLAAVRELGAALGPTTSMPNADEPTVEETVESTPYAAVIQLRRQLDVQRSLFVEAA